MRITGTMPRSIVSTTSAWCSASRAAHEIASDGVVSAERVEVARPRRAGAGRAARGSQRSTVRPTRPVKPMKSTASATLKPRWNSDDLLVQRRHELLQQHVQPAAAAAIDEQRAERA